MPELLTRTDVTLAAALQVLEGARAEAERRGVAMGLAVVDLGGALVAGQRMDGAQLPALDLAIGKAYTAAAFDAPTEAWAQSTAPGGSDWGMSTALGGRLVVFAGGLPLRAGGRLAGGVGVSGGPGAVDRACAVAGLQAAGFEAVDAET
jgi:uncharacterized protein GlcG (DUF336 family)